MKKKNLIALSIIILGVIAFSVYYFKIQKKDLITAGSIGGVTFTNKVHDTINHIFYVTAQSDSAGAGTKAYFSEPKRLKINGDLFQAIVPDVEYESVSVQFVVPYDQAEELELIDSNGNLVLDKLLSDFSLVQEYGYITTVTFKHNF